MERSEHENRPDTKSKKIPYLNIFEWKREKVDINVYVDSKANWRIYVILLRVIALE